MSEPASNGNGRTLSGAVAGVAKRLVEVLPGPFLALCLVNTMFLWVVFSYEARQVEARAALIEKLIEIACTHRQGT